MNAPCKDCEKRHFLCHAECDEYKAYSEYCHERSRKRREDSEFACYLSVKYKKIEKKMQSNRRMKKR